MSDQVSTAGLLDLPSEVLVIILSELDTKDLVNVMQVCNQLRNIATTGSLWKNISNVVIRLNQDYDLPWNKEQERCLTRGIVQCSRLKSLKLVNIPLLQAHLLFTNISHNSQDMSCLDIVTPKMVDVGILRQLHNLRYLTITYCTWDCMTDESIAESIVDSNKYLIVLTLNSRVIGRHTEVWNFSSYNQLDDMKLTTNHNGHAYEFFPSPYSPKYKGLMSKYNSEPPKYYTVGSLKMLPFVLMYDFARKICFPEFAGTIFDYLTKNVCPNGVEAGCGPEELPCRLCIKR